MSFINIEIKAKCFHPEKVEAFLFSKNATFRGTDHQKDTYFNCPNGRLKLRQGNIENNLIFYKRSDLKGPKQSDFQIAPVNEGAAMEDLLSEALGRKTTIEKIRKIYFLDNVKVHLDEVKDLESFVEIEASNLYHPHLTVIHLQQQCEDLIKAFEITEEDLLEKSYSDMLPNVML